jgi:hypothetical protein
MFPVTGTPVTRPLTLLAGLLIVLGTAGCDSGSDSGAEPGPTPGSASSPASPAPSTSLPPPKDPATGTPASTNPSPPAACGQTKVSLEVGTRVVPVSGQGSVGITVHKGATIHVVPTGACADEAAASATDAEVLSAQADDDDPSSQPRTFVASAPGQTSLSVSEPVCAEPPGQPTTAACTADALLVSVQVTVV